MASDRSVLRSRLRAILACLVAAVLSLAANDIAVSADVSTDKDKLRLDTALAHLEAQIPLTSADHNSLKRAAMQRQVAGLRVCGDPGNLPLSDIHRAVYEVKII